MDETDEAPRRPVGRWALLGTLILVTLVLADLRGQHPASLIQPGQEGPAVEAVIEDFPGLDIPDGLGLDGQMVYAIARDPWPVDAAADHLDRPRYRLQRPLLPWLGAALHPGGGGTGLIWALAAVGMAGALVGAVALGRLSVTWGGPAWIAALFPLLPGAYWSLRVTVGDALAVALALLAVGLAIRGRTAPAIAIGVAAVLAKEPTFLILAGWALGQRTRQAGLVAGIPGLVAGAWMVALRVLVPGHEGLNGDIGLPFVGLLRATTDIWLDGRELVGMASTLGALALGLLALWRRGLHHPVGIAIALQLALLLVSGPNPLGMNFGGTRTGLALAALAILALATPRGPRIPPWRTQHETTRLSPPTAVG